MSATSGEQTRSISIHALREEGDPVRNGFEAISELFLSTPSVRRATVERGVHADAVDISIHALREEGDAHCCAPFSR